MPSRKKLEDLEYNVFRKDMDDNHESILAGKDTGCLSVLAALIVTVVVIVVIIGFMQIGRNGPAPHCAAPGCSNKPRPGSNYCWLHASSYSGRGSGGSIGSGSGNSSSQGSSAGTDSSSSGSNKIWGGSTGRNEAPQSGSLIN